MRLQISTSQECLRGSPFCQPVPPRSNLSPVVAPAYLEHGSWADDTGIRLGLEVTVCHYPTGASKWNPIEHRLFGPISINWAVKPLRTLEAMLAYIRGTTTQTGLKVKAFLLDGHYEKGLKVPDWEMQALNLERHEVCPNWNYTIRPRAMAFAP